MDEVQAKREPVIVTKNGKPVAKIVPAEEEADRSPFQDGELLGYW